MKPEESYMNAYAEEIYKSEQFRTSTKRLSLVLYAKYKKAYLNKVMKNKYYNLTKTQRNEYLKV